MSEGRTNKGQKRKLADVSPEAAEPPAAEAVKLVAVLRDEIAAVRSAPSSFPDHRQNLRRAAHSLAELAKKEDNVDDVVEAGAVYAIVPLLTLRQELGQADAATSSGDDIEKEACFAIGLLAIKQAHQQRIADAGALPGLVALLKRAPLPSGSHNSTAGGVARRAADAITNLAHENVSIKTKVRTEGGIPPLVALLESHDSKVQRAAAGALRTLAFKNEDNKNTIVECGALPHLVFMVRDPDTNVHYEAVGVLGNLVHSSPLIKKKVLEEGALQPVIGLLSSPCTESQREAALLLGQFATTPQDNDGRAAVDYKTRIVQRGAVRPLIQMLGNDDAQLKEMAAFALGRLAQNQDNQAGICQGGGLKPLLNLLDSRNGSLQHNAAFALYGLADNDDNVSEIIKEGGLQRLMDGNLIVQASKDCVAKTLKRLEDKVTGRVLQYLLYLLRQGERSSDKEVPRRVAVSLAHLCKEDDMKLVFLERNGLSILLDMLAMSRTPKECQFTSSAHAKELQLAREAQAQREAARALAKLAEKAQGRSPLDCTPQPPDQQVRLGRDYVNNKAAADVTFIVEDRDFHAHRIALLASSDAFRAMFDGGYRERDAAKIEIPNIRWEVFEAMMQCVYTGSVEVTPDIAQDLLQAADQYLLEGLKRLCESAIAQRLSVENLVNVYELSEAYHAPQLGNMCALFALDHHADLVAAHGEAGYTALWQRTSMQQHLRTYMEMILSRPPTVEAPKDV